MRNLLLLTLGLLLIAGVAQAAQFTLGGGTVAQGTLAGRAPVQFTQNNDPTTVGNTQVACGVAGSYTTQNWFLRRFFLADDHGIVDALTVNSVDFGISVLSIPSPINLDLFSIPYGENFVFANMTQIGTAVVNIDPGQQGMIVNAAVSGVINDPFNEDLVVAIDAPDGSLNGLRFYPGANDAGAIQDAYIAAADCGINDPVSVSSIGFPTSQTIFVVYGETGAPSATTVTTWGAVKGLYK